LSIPILNITFSFVYTVEYNEAKIIYSILSFGIIFKVVSFLQTTHFILEEKTAKITFKMIIGVFLNFLLNFLLLKLNLKGIAIATTVTQILTLYLLDYFITEYREIFFLQTNSFKFWKVKDDIKNIQLLKSITLEIEDDLLKKVEE
jgi:O-antigen/teichoic acid export membrane protein